MSTQESNLVPYPRHKLVLVEESTGLTHVHIRLSSEAKALMMKYAERFPDTKWIAQITDRPSHRYPEKEEDRALAFVVGQLFRELGSIIEDPEETAQYLLMVCAAISLSMGQLIDEDLVASFPTPTILSPDTNLEIWNDVDVTSLERRQAVYTKKATDASFILEVITDIAVSDYHPFPETTEEKALAKRLRLTIEELMKNLLSNDARNFLLATAARLLQIGTLANPALENIYDANRQASDRLRGSRMHGDTNEENTFDRDDEDHDNILPWGNITW